MVETAKAKVVRLAQGNPGSQRVCLNLLAYPWSEVEVGILTLGEPLRERVPAIVKGNLVEV